MTPADAKPPDYAASSTRSTGVRPATRKSVLFCAECGHEGEVSGDWVTRDDYVRRVREVRCPECDDCLTGRPLPWDSLDPECRPSGPLGDAVAAWVDVWASSASLWFEWPRCADC